MDYKQLGKRIKTERQAKGLSQEQLAELISCSSTHISHLENASTKMSLDIFVAIANALQISPDKLLCDSIYQSSAVLTDEIADVFSNATSDQMYIMLQTARAVKTSMETRLRNH